MNRFLHWTREFFSKHRFWFGGKPLYKHVEPKITWNDKCIILGPNSYWATLSGSCVVRPAPIGRYNAFTSQTYRAKCCPDKATDNTLAPNGFWPVLSGSFLSEMDNVPKARSPSKWSYLNLCQKVCFKRNCHHSFTFRHSLRSHQYIFRFL